MEPIGNARLMAGAGRAVIGYPEDFFPYRGFRGRRFTGIHDDIHARALLLKSGDTEALIISVELGDITDEWTPEISRLTGIPAGHIWLTATHTHEAPYANSTWGEEVGDAHKTAPFCACCLDAVMDAVRQARDSLRPARLSYGEGTAYVNVNRDRKYTGRQSDITAPYVSANNPHGYSDRTVAVLKLEDLDGKPLAYLVNYAVHSSVLFRQSWDDSEGMLISGDLFGAAMRHVEARTSGAVALFTLGAAGDQNPRFSAVHAVFDGDGNMSWADYGDCGYALADALASELGDEVLQVAASLAPGVQAAPIRIGSEIIRAAAKEKWEKGPPTRLPPGYAWQPDGEMDLRLYLLHVGTVTLLGVPGELVASVGADLKRALAGAGCPNPVVVTQCNGAVQYMSDDDGYTNRTFEATQSHFAPGIGESLKSGALTLARRLHEQSGEG